MSASGHAPSPSMETFLVCRPPLSHFSRGCPWISIRPRPPAPLIPLLMSRELCVHAGAFPGSRGAWLCAPSLAGASSWACRVQSEQSVLRSPFVGIAQPSPLASPPPGIVRASSRPAQWPQTPRLPPRSGAQSPSPPQRPRTSPLTVFPGSRQLCPLQGESQSSDSFTLTPGRARRASGVGRVPWGALGTGPPHCPQGHRTLDVPHVSELRVRGHWSCWADPSSLRPDPRRGRAGHCPGGKPRHACPPRRPHTS